MVPDQNSIQMNGWFILAIQLFKIHVGLANLYHLYNWMKSTDTDAYQPDELNSLRPRQNRRYNADDIFKCIFLKENVWIPTTISLKFVPKGPISNIPA